MWCAGRHLLPEGLILTGVQWPLKHVCRKGGQVSVTVFACGSVCPSRNADVRGTQLRRKKRRRRSHPSFLVHVASRGAVRGDRMLTLPGDLHQRLARQH